MHPDLMGTPGTRLRHDQARNIPDLKGNEIRHRPLTSGVDANDTLTRTVLLAQQRRFAAPTPAAEVASGEGEIAFAHPFLSQRLMQRREHTAAFRDQKTPRRITVESVDKLDPAVVRSGGAQTFDDSEIQSAAAMHGPSGRLVQDDQSIVLVDDRPIDVALPHLGRCPPWPGLAYPNRRDPHDVAGSQTVVLSHPATIDSDLAATQQPVNPCAWNAFQIARQEVVDALPRGRLVHGDLVRRFPAQPVYTIHRKIVPV